MSHWRTLGAVALLLAVIGCPRSLPQGQPADEIYRVGREDFESGRYTRAIEVFQLLLFQEPGYPKADSAQYLLSESYYQNGDYLIAASEFLRLARNRPSAALADDARYRACDALSRLSPRPELDQQYTQDAIEQCRQTYLLYPDSPFADAAKNVVTELSNKLARKYYLTGDYYYGRNAYDSAIIYLEYVLENYPGSIVEPQTMLRLYRSYMKVGYVKEAEQIRESLLRQYPDSGEARELGGPSGGLTGR